ncbi:mevalonate kinase family protein [Fluviicola taffensis]|uniref:mevalonate kinase n=1 Tax=Fluviicola taffensis (strain DSM 16823 / NCIMB 13979 / RW262) TaxID=755732 RepID=F2I9K8_FLUTR|nr:GHMP kinase [Fluviicola taffensis]AEA45189.1 GHMP kinase [Fluviicola taffensis DSM 16823]
MESVHSKILVFGEYGVLHNGMALTIPFSKFSGKLCYPENVEESAIAVLSNKGIREFFKHILENHPDDTFKLNVNELSRELDKGLFFRSDIPQGFGLGSSGALVAAIFLRYLEKAGDFKDELKHLTMERIQSLKSSLGALEGHFHGKSSGIDPLSIIINKPLLLKANKEIVKVDIPVYNETGKNVLFLLNTGVARNSEKLIKKFNSACEKEGFQQKLETELIEYNNAGITDFLKGDTENFYLNLEKIVRFQLQEMDYLIPEKYQSIVQQGLDKKDYYLKICGAGGGGYMIGFTQNWEETQQLLKDEDLEVFYRF